MKRELAALTILVLVLACGRTAPKQLNLYPSPTVEASTTSWIVQITTTPNATQTPFFVVVSPTPNASLLCVDALVALYLRPSPNEESYPIQAVPNGTHLLDLGGRSGKWIYVQLGDKQGWVSSDYLKHCT